jgi:molybdopterin-guanine dinucleotide biosynthesis protein A
VVWCLVFSIFEIAPGAKALFKFTEGFDDDDDALYSSPGFLAHARGVVSMLDIAVNMLGPDLEPVAYALEELGAKHSHYGVLPAHYPVVGEALLSTLETALGDAWTPTVQEGWTAIYVFISTTMIKGAVNTLKGDDENSAISTAGK